MLNNVCLRQSIDMIRQIIWKITKILTHSSYSLVISQMHSA